MGKNREQRDPATRLTPTLLTKLGVEETEVRSSRHASKKKKAQFPVGRKQRRREERAAAKARKSQQPLKRTRTPDRASPQAAQAARATAGKSDSPKDSKPSKNAAGGEAPPTSDRKRKRESDSKKSTKEDREQEEDRAEIARLERLLRATSKKKKKHKDGALDYSIEFSADKDDGLGELLLSIPKWAWTDEETKSLAEEDQEETIHLDTASEPDRGEKGCDAYVPPAIRNKPVQSTATVAPEVFGRRLRGLLNRLADANASKIANDTAELVVQASKGLSREELIASFVDPVLDTAADSRGMAGVNPYIPSLASTFGAVGLRCGAVWESSALRYMLKRIVQTIERKDIPGYGYAELLIELYRRKIVDCALPYSLVRLLLGQMDEYSIELLLVILRKAGPLMRSDDPNALKDIVSEVRTRAAEVSTDDNIGHSVRVQTMLLMIDRLKNNVIVEDTDLSASYKWLLDLRITRPPATLTVSDATESAKENSNDDLDDEEFRYRSELRTEEAAESSAVRALASEQRLNTEFRRSVFEVLMDCLGPDDAIARIQALATKEGQDRDVVRVIIQCCGQEQTFNVFYAILLAKLCQQQKAYFLSTQYALWDQMKQIDKSDGQPGMSKRKCVNLGTLLGHLVRQNVFDLRVLRGIDDFAGGSDLVVRFVATVLVEAQNPKSKWGDRAILPVLRAIPSGEQSAGLRQSLAIFINSRIAPSKRLRGSPALDSVLVVAEALKSKA